MKKKKNYIDFIIPGNTFSKVNEMSSKLETLRCIFKLLWCKRIFVFCFFIIFIFQEVGPQNYHFNRETFFIVFLWQWSSNQPFLCILVYNSHKETLSLILVWEFKTNLYLMQIFFCSSAIKYYVLYCDCLKKNQHFSAGNNNDNFTALIDKECKLFV